MTTRLVIGDERTLRGAKHARSSGEAIAALAHANHPRDEVWFDFDLGGEDTTLAVLHWLEARAAAERPLPLAAAVVHSANPVGARRLVQTLSGMVPTRRVAPTALQAAER